MLINLFLYELNKNKLITSSHRNSVFNSFIDSKSCSSNTLLPLNENDCKIKNKKLLSAKISKLESNTNKLSSEFSSEYDIACFRSKAFTLNDLQIKNLIRNAFVPNESYSFPKTNGRSFQLIWLKQFSWLSYSPSEDGAYCLSCVLFGFKYSSKSSR